MNESTESMEDEYWHASNYVGDGEKGSMMVVGVVTVVDPARLIARVVGDRWRYVGFVGKDTAVLGEPFP